MVPGIKLKIGPAENNFIQYFCTILWYFIFKVATLNIEKDLRLIPGQAEILRPKNLATWSDNKTISGVQLDYKKSEKFNNLITKTIHGQETMPLDQPSQDWCGQSIQSSCVGAH